MTKQKIHILSLLILFLYSCVDKDQSEIQRNEHSQLKIHAVNNRLRGVNYTDSLGQQCYYRTLTTHLTNDTTIPINLHLHLPNQNVELLPKADKKFKIFLLPETYVSETKNSMTPTAISFNNESEKPKDLNKVIQPGETYTINIEFFFNSNSTTGITRAQMLFNNQKTKAYTTDTLIKLSGNESLYSNILLNVSLESQTTGIGTYSTTILCGNMTFTK